MDQALQGACPSHAAANCLSALLAGDYFGQTGFMHRYEYPTDGMHTAMDYPVDFSMSSAGMRHPPRSANVAMKFVKSPNAKRSGLIARGKALCASAADQIAQQNKRNICI